MESVNPVFALSHSKNECARTDGVFSSPYLRSALAVRSTEQAWQPLPEDLVRPPALPGDREW